MTTLRAGLGAQWSPGRNGRGTLVPMLRQLSAILSACVAAASAPAHAQDETATRPPNVLIVLVDDLGYGDLGTGVAGLPGVEHHRTPHLAAFSSESLVLTHGYSAAPNCAPSRATLQTGRLTPRHGIITVGSSARGKAANRKLVPVKNRKDLAPEEVTLAEQLAPAGYSSIHLGKWHLGPDPCSQGYDMNVGGSRAGHPKSYFAPFKNVDLGEVEDGACLTERLTDEAIAALDRLEPPFLMHLAYYTVHTPLQAEPERVQERLDAGVKGKARATYAAMVERLDSEFGRLMAALDSKGLAGDTLVLFTSDNGGLGSVTNRAPLRGFKGTLDEGGVRVPWMLRLPGRIEPGVDATPVHHMDVLPTLAALAGVEPAAEELDGCDLGPLVFQRDEMPVRDLLWHFPAYLEGRSDRFERWRTTPGSSIRRGRWKLLEFHESRRGKTRVFELYDLLSDPKEERDVASVEVDMVASLRAALDGRLGEVGARFPAERDTGGR